MSESFLPSDSDLLAEFAESGSERPFEVLVRRHGGLVLSVCRGILRDANDAEDAAQAAFLTLARKAVSLRGQRTIAGWLHTVAWHISCRARRARSLRQQREREAAEASAASHRVHDSSEQFEDTSLLHEQLHAMSDKYRLPLILHHLDGWSESEVAQILGCKLGTISGRLARGRQILKQRLEARGMHGTTRATAGATAGASIAASAATFSGPMDDIDRQRAAPAAAFIAVASRAGSMIQREGGVTGGAVSTQAAALSDGVLRGMQRSKIRAIVAVAVAFAIVGTLVGLIAFNAAPRSIDGGAATAAPPQTFFPRVARSDNSITGTLLDPDGKPAVKVLVRLYASKADAVGGRRAMGRTWTRADGSFVIDNVAPGKTRYLLCYIEEPTPMHADAYVDIAPFQTVELGTLTLKAGRY